MQWTQPQTPLHGLAHSAFQSFHCFQLNQLPCKHMGNRWKVIPRLFGFMGLTVVVQSIRGTPQLGRIGGTSSKNSVTLQVRPSLEFHFGVLWHLAAPNPASHLCRRTMDFTRQKVSKALRIDVAENRRRTCIWKG
ncbi:unnamed protein product [Pleuronectes platessa]|uniref:Uncharacterized protein n=1 Tax=Pleuronectes platessa TaxID=8262 RepID=A0A9N7Y509_PLEPL|nr:unnamed protein product [Pleuronectes platessa]